MKDIASKYFKYIVLASLIYMPIFGHLDNLPIRIWDESRLAINAYEMSKDGNYMVTHFDGKPDMWNTKPPLLIWMQMICMKSIGVNEISVRLPSAIATFLTCLVLLVFSIRYLKQFWFGFIAVMVLITSQGYISLHATRTGDYDALLTLFTTLGGLLFFAFSETKNNRYLYLFFVATTLAVLTKSIAGLLFMPAIAIYSLWQKQFLSLLKNKHFYWGLISFLIVVVGYYWLRETHNHGYLAAVMENEFGGRYLHVIEDHSGDFWFYYDHLIDRKLTEWCLLIPCGIIVGFVSKNPRINKITLFSLLMTFTFFLIISFGQSKLEWYDLPMYPFLAIFVTIFIFYVFDVLKNLEWIKHPLKSNVIPFVFLFLILITPYRKILDKTFFPQEYAGDKDFYEIGYFLKEAVKGKQDVDKSYLLHDGYYAHIEFYLNILHDKGVNISFKNWKNLEKGDRVIAHQGNVKDYLKNNYTYEIISDFGNVTKYKIIDRKPLQN